VSKVSHLQLRALDDADLSSLDDDDKREALAEWVESVRGMLSVDLFAITDDGAVVGAGALFGLTGEREIAFRVTGKAVKHGVAAEAVQALIAREPERPVFARAAASDERAVTVLENAGFTEDERIDDEIRFVLTPTLDGA
jgi:RimJ/RimL family protein N-acetyltransferase